HRRWRVRQARRPHGHPGARLYPQRHVCGPWECIACPPGVIHGYQNGSLEPVYFQVMLGRGRPDTMGYVDDELYRRRDAHLGRSC
ncbi:MAG TPA: hypothetical protein VM910_16930, partial [Bradyrhizobium sp.]|nr:hypothetical protein [Bradyrhizobium sp.]